jgi:small subunit ribosomal protein S20
MANKKSARKRAVKSLELKQKNRAARSRMRTAVKTVRQAIDAGSDKAETLLAQAISVIDTTAQKGIVHRNTAARTKARLTAAANKAK